MTSNSVKMRKNPKVGFRLVDGNILNANQWICRPSCCRRILKLALFLHLITVTIHKFCHVYQFETKAQFDMSHFHIHNASYKYLSHILEFIYIYMLVLCNDMADSGLFLCTLQSSNNLL